MALIDERGKLLGRFNLIDAALLFLVLGLIPLGYGAYALFRTPPPQVTAIEPATVQLEPSMRLRIRGVNLRPYMRISLDNNQTRQFLFQDPTIAEVVFADIPPGQYDVVLYDFAQERSRLPKALTITPPALPITEVYAAGFLSGVTEKLLPTLKPGFSFQGLAQIVSVGRKLPDTARIASGDRNLEIPNAQSERLEVLLKVPCTVQTMDNGVANCRANSANGAGVFLGPPLGPGIYLLLPLFDVRLPFLISQVRPVVEPTMIDVSVKVPPSEDAGELARVGDVDVGAGENQFASGGVVTRAMHGDRELGFRVPAYPTTQGWDYAGQRIRVGTQFVFITNRYQLVGTLSKVPDVPSSPAK